MKILVTGATGFVGKHLLNLLLEKKIETYGTSFHDNKKHEGATILRLDMNDRKSISDLLSSVKPDGIFHLAAFTSPRDSFKNPIDTFNNNIDSQVNLLEEIRNQNLKSRVIIISSAEIYGKVSQKNLPINEETPFNPTNPYAVSKLAQDFMALQYFNSYGMDIVRLRPFNHTGPGQSDSFVIPAFASKIAKVEKGQASEINVGNLDNKRDFTDVRDIVKAYFFAFEKGRAGDVYNIGSGISYKISDILTKLISFSTKQISIKSDPSLMMPIDNPELICDPSNFKNLTGWSPEIPLEKTLVDTLDYWRNVV